VAAGVVGVRVGVEDLRDLAAVPARGFQAPPPLEGIDRERLAGLRAGDEIVEVAQGISGPDAFRQHHKGAPSPSCRAPYRERLPRAIMRAWPIRCAGRIRFCSSQGYGPRRAPRSEEHTSELQSHLNLVCRLLLANAPAPPRLFNLSLHDALPICCAGNFRTRCVPSTS